MSCYIYELKRRFTSQYRIQILSEMYYFSITFKFIDGLILIIMKLSMMNSYCRKQPKKLWFEKMSVRLSGLQSKCTYSTLQTWNYILTENTFCDYSWKALCKSYHFSWSQISSWYRLIYISMQCWAVQLLYDELVLSKSWSILVHNIERHTSMIRIYCERLFKWYLTILTTYELRHYIKTCNLAVVSYNKHIGGKI